MSMISIHTLAEDKISTTFNEDRAVLHKKERFDTVVGYAEFGRKANQYWLCVYESATAMIQVLQTTGCLTRSIHDPGGTNV